MAKTSQNCTTPQYLGSERYILLEDDLHYAYIDITKAGKAITAIVQTGVASQALSISGPYIGEKKKVLQEAMDQVISFWQLYDDIYIEKLSYPADLQKTAKQIKIF